MRMTCVNALLFFILSSMSVCAATEVKALVSAKETTVGEPVDFIVSVSSAEMDPVISVPEQRKYYAEDVTPADKTKKPAGQKPEDRLPLFAVDSADIQDLSTKESTNKTLKVRVVYFAPGQYVMPPVTVKGKDGAVSLFEYPSVNVKAVNEQGQNADIEPPLSLNGNYTRIIILVLLSLCAGAAGFALFRYFRRKTHIDEKALKVHAIVYFREELQVLRLQLEGEGIAPGEYGQKVSDVFRRLIAAMYTFDAAEMTSREILAHIVSSRKGLTAERYGESLEQIMNLWDMTKFAEFTPSAEILSVNLNETSSLAEKMWRDNGGF